MAGSCTGCPKMKARAATRAFDLATPPGPRGPLPDLRRERPALRDEAGGVVGLIDVIVHHEVAALVVQGDVTPQVIDPIRHVPGSAGAVTALCLEDLVLRSDTVAEKRIRSVRAAVHYVERDAQAVIVPQLDVGAIEHLGVEQLGIRVETGADHKLTAGHRRVEPGDAIDSVADSHDLLEADGAGS